RSRCRTVSKISRSGMPVIDAARSASSCSSCFFELALSPGMIAGTSIRSLRSIPIIPCAPPLLHPAPFRGRAGRRCLSLGCHGGGRVDPADIAVGPAVDDVDLVVAGIAEHEDRAVLGVE